MIDNTITGIRKMTNALMSSVLDDFGVGAALNDYVQDLQRSTVVVVINFSDSTLGKDTRVNKNQQVNLFRIAQELINNTIKHGKANKIQLTLSEFEDFVSLYYFDDGGGFDLYNVKMGSGITNIRERVEIFNGTIEIETTRGNTIFEIELPIKPDSDD